jgi:glycosyltransferase involved in cell wall biosynthesis
VPTKNKEEGGRKKDVVLRISSSCLLPLKLSSISACFPAYNDGGTIASLVIVAARTLPQIADDFEIIVGNDASTDYTAEVVDELTRHYPCLRVLHHSKNLGYGGNLRRLFAAARKDWIFYTDGDAQYDPHEMTHLAEAAHDNVDWVNGYKITRHDPFHRILIGGLYHHFVKFMFRLPLRDTDCDFRLFRRSLYERVQLESDTGAIALELVKKFADAGGRWAEVPVNHFHRAYGQSQFFNFPRLWRTVIQLSQLWWKLVVRKEHLH